MDGPVNATVEIPMSFDIMSSYELQIISALDCPGKNDISCPIWDRSLQLLVACDGSSKFEELGRWITSFKRGSGTWATNITSLMPLLNGNSCTFQFAINGSGGGVNDPWRPSASLRFFNQNLNRPKPTQILSLFNGGSFTTGYNDHDPISFNPPSNTVRVELFAVITGHGCNSEYCCAEFCATTHIFRFQNSTSSSSVETTFENAGTEMGCAESVSTGVVPNEYGTWLYGRDGWCDGRNVFPWVTDVTSMIDLQNENQVMYFGMFDGMLPDKQPGGAYTILYSYLTFYTLP